MQGSVKGKLRVLFIHLRIHPCQQRFKPSVSQKVESIVESLNARPSKHGPSSQSSFSSLFNSDPTTSKVPLSRHITSLTTFIIITLIPLQVTSTYLERSNSGLCCCNCCRCRRPSFAFWCGWRWFLLCFLSRFVFFPR